MKHPVKILACSTLIVFVTGTYEGINIVRIDINSAANPYPTKLAIKPARANGHIGATKDPIL